jgi:hypothetical protein
MSMVKRISIIFSVSVVTIISLLSSNNITYLLSNTYAQLQTNDSGGTTGQKVSFLTDDGVLIVGTYYLFCFITSNNCYESNYSLTYARP